MLIALGGILGSGRSKLSQELALHFGLHHYDISAKKRHRPILDREGNFPAIQPATDEERVKIYERVLEDFPFLAKLHENVIVDDLFHREVPRGYFLNEARKYFDPVVFVWVDADTETIMKHLEQMRERGKILSVEAGLNRRKRAHEMKQLAENTVPTFLCTSSIESDCRALWALIQAEINHEKD